MTQRRNVKGGCAKSATKSCPTTRNARAKKAARKPMIKQTKKAAPRLRRRREPVDSDSDTDSDCDSDSSSSSASSAASMPASGGIVPRPSLTPTEIFARLRNCVSEGSQVTYASYQNTVRNRGYSWDLEGLMTFILSQEPDCVKLSNSTIAGIVSAFNKDLAKRGLVTDGGNKALLKAVQQTRMLELQDADNMKGAMTSDRTEIFIAFLQELVTKGQLSETHRQLYADAATMLYACALRIFQLKELLGNDNSSYRNKNVNDLYITVICKAWARKRSKGQPDTEQKQVHPLYAAKVRAIVSRLCKAGNAQLFTCFTPHLITKFGILVQECATLNKWPSQLKFKGTHMFRNGAAVDAFAESDSLRFVMARTGHLSEKCAWHYAQSEMERLQKAEYASKKRMGQEAMRRQIITDAAEDAKKHVAAGTVSQIRQGARSSALAVAADAAVTARPAPATKPVTAAPPRNSPDVVVADLSDTQLCEILNSRRVIDIIKEAIRIARQPPTVPVAQSDAAVADDLDALRIQRYLPAQVSMLQRLGFLLPGT